MSWVGKLKKFLQQNRIAKILLYIGALVEPVTFALMFYTIGYSDSLFLVNPYYVLWLSFYACLLLWWLSEEGSAQWIISCLLGLINGLIILVFVFIALIGGAVHLPLLLLFLLCPFAVPLAVWSKQPLAVLIGCILVIGVIGFWIYRNKFQKA